MFDVIRLLFLLRKRYEYSSAASSSEILWNAFSHLSLLQNPQKVPKCLVIKPVVISQG